MTEEVDQKQRFLKGLVIFLGILLVICFFIVAGTIVYRLATPSDPEPEVAPAEASSPIAKPAEDDPVSEVPMSMPGMHAEVVRGDLDIAIPAGARVISVSAQGGNYLVLLDRGNRQLMLIVDAETGQLLRQVNFESAD